MTPREIVSREIVLRRSAIVAAVGVLAALLALFGVDLDPATRDRLVDVLVVVLPVVLPLASALWARLHVTPVIDPRDQMGQPLVPAYPADHGIDPAGQ